jgi:tetratricopeptide (TPR) repeat protein
VCLLAVCAFTPCGPAVAELSKDSSRSSRSTGEVASRDAFEWAFRFATAIETDPKDKASAQQLALLSLAEVGRIDDAEDWASRMDGWRQGVVAAELAAEALRAGDQAQANRLIEMAERAAGKHPEWRLRIRSHLTKALALRGEEETIRAVGERMAEDPTGQFAGQGAYGTALALAVEGRPDKALAELEKLDEVEDLYGAHRRTQAYLEIAKLDSLPAAMRRTFLDRAVESGRGVPGLLKTRTLTEAAGELARHGRHEKAVAVLEEVESLALQVPDGADPKPPVLCNLARAWAEIGEEKRARTVLPHIHEAIRDERVLKTDRPGFIANQASLHMAMGDEKKARSLYDAALGQAAELVNARPRALAVVRVCTFMGRYGFTPDDKIAKRLEELFAGLGAPW